MRPRPAVLLLGCVSIAALLATAAGREASARDDGAALPEGPAREAVVLELFTSQGCSSCPPADRLLASLGREGALAGRTLVPLAFHVDYWDYIGWKDPFSSANWSRRQQRYSRAFGLRSIYTPQLVINGRSELVGSNEAEVRHEIAREAVARSTGTVSLVVDEARRDRLRISVEARLERPAASPVEALVALFETGLVTEVGRGENARKTLRNEYVVRRLTPAFTLEAGSSNGRRENLEIELHPSWKLDNLGVAAFLQESESMTIHGGAVSSALPASR